MEEIIYKLVWTDSIRIAWVNQYAWRNFRKSCWYLSFKRHNHWKYIDKKISEIAADSYQFCLFGLNAAVKIKR